jgi:hypothetical protein
MRNTAAEGAEGNDVGLERSGKRTDFFTSLERGSPRKLLQALSPPKGQGGPVITMRHD